MFVFCLYWSSGCCYVWVGFGFMCLLVVLVLCGGLGITVVADRLAVVLCVFVIVRLCYFIVVGWVLGLACGVNLWVVCLVLWFLVVWWLMILLLVFICYYIVCFVLLCLLLVVLFSWWFCICTVWGG